ncbi:MAG: putative Ribonuclease [Candidatus Saccharibacteria bacterium]|nr:putative Ribonuclease [Candidatus Saccharibacteria bacterium]
MITRSHRFHGHGSLRYVYQHGKTVRGPLCALKYAQNDRRNTYRLAIVVSKKVHKSAVVRNRIRRRLYEAFRLETATLTAPYDMVVTVFHEQIAEMPAEELRRMVHAQLKQSEILTTL